MGAKVTKQKFIEKINQRNEFTEYKKIECLNPENILDYKTTNTPFTFKCDCGHIWYLTMYSRILDPNYAACEVCRNKDRFNIRQKESFDKLITVYQNRYEYPYFYEEFMDSSSIITIICKKHGVFKKSYTRHLHGDHGEGEVCPQCNKEDKEDGFVICDEYLTIFNEMQLKMTNIKHPSNKHQDIECLICGNTFNATPKSKVQHYRTHRRPGCPICVNETKYIDVRIASLEKLKERFDIIDTIDYRTLTNMTKIKVKSKECGHIFTSRYGNLLNRDVRCGVCNIMRDQYNNELHEVVAKSKEGFDRYKFEVNKLTEQNYKLYKNEINPNDYDRVLLGKDGYQLDHIISKVYCFNANVPVEICAHKDNLRMISNIDNVSKGGRIYQIDEVPDIFYSYMSDTIGIKNEFRDTIINLQDDFIPEYYVDNYKLSLFSDKLQKGILLATFSEYKWASTLAKNHLQKLKTFFNERNQNVIIIYEDEWRENKDLVIAKIKYFLGKSESKIINARDCEIKLIEMNDKHKFLSKYHIQRACNARIAVGAYYNDELIAVMTFDRPRIFMEKNHKQNRFELVRFATNDTYRATGIASRLFQFMIRNIKEMNNGINEIVSYADRRWSNGKLYDTLGFSLTAMNPSNYDYIMGTNRYHRFAFTKAKIKEKFPDVYDENKTEKEMMEQAGMDRIYNAGILTYVYNIN